MRRDVRERVEAVLVELRRVKDIRGLAVVRRDGLLVAHDLSEEEAAEKVAAMSAAMVGTSEIASQELARGTFQRTLVEASDGRFLTVGAGERAILVALLRKGCNLGLVLVHLERAARELATLLTAEVVPGDVEESVAVGGPVP